MGEEEQTFLEDNISQIDMNYIFLRTISLPR